MFSSFRLSMTWLHTWFGLVLGYVLIVVFFFGTLSVVRAFAVPSPSGRRWRGAPAMSSPPSRGNEGLAYTGPFRI